MADVQGWTAGPAPAAAWTAGPAPVADSRASNEKDAHGNAVTGDWLDRLVGWLPAAGGVTGGLLGAAGGPPGAVMGAALGGAAGEAYKELIRRARGLSAVPSSSLDAAKEIGKEGAIQGGAQLAGEIAAPYVKAGVEALGERMMQSAAKPGLKYLTKAVKAGDTTPQAVKTLLQEGVNVSPNGVAKLQTLLDATNDEISAAIKGSTATIPPLKVASRLSQTAQRFAGQVNPQADLNAISDVGENFLDAHGAQDLTVPAAQALKRGTYAALKSKAYGEVKGATIEAEKALARGLKEEIAAEVPQVSALNAREGKLLEALDVVGRRVALAGNRDPIGFAWVAHNPTTFLAALMDRSPAVKSFIARGLWNAAGTAAKVPPQAIRIAVQALASEDAQGALGSSSDRGNPR